MAGCGRLRLRGCVLRDHLDYSHHAAVLVLEEVAMIGKRADNTGVPEVHTQFYTGILGTDPVPFDQHEMDLVDVEGVQFAGPIFDDPVFDVSLGDDDVWDCICWIKKFWLLAFDGDVKVGAAVGVFWIARIFGEVEGAGSDWLYIA